MSIELTFLGHATFVVTCGEHRVAIDPYLTDNPAASCSPDQVKCDTVVLTHGHADHIADAEAVAKANDAVIIGANEVCEYFGEKGCKTNPAAPGGKVDTDFGFVAMTMAIHSSAFEGRYMGMPCGAIVNIGGVSIYHLGDTGLFSDLKLIGELYKPDIALIPVGDRFTMGPEHGAMAAEWIKPKIAVPMHYGTWPLLVSDISAFTPKGVEVRKMQSGETLTYG